MKRTKLNLIAALLAFLSLPLAAQNTEDEFEIIFTDDGNLQSLCKYHHDQKTALEQARDKREQ